MPAANKIEDVWKHIHRGKDTECWPHIGRERGDGYGAFSFRNKEMLAHRVVAEIALGPPPKGAVVMHKCNNRKCCNPQHLRYGTLSENQRHASATGTRNVGLSGVRGVCFMPHLNRYIAHGSRNGVRSILYSGPNRAKALKARINWEKDNLIYYKENEHEF